MWFAKLFQRRQDQKAVAEVLERIVGVPVHQFKDFSDYLSAASKKLWATWRACDIVGQAVMQTQYSLTRDGKSDPVKVAGLSDLLEAPNQLQTFQELLYLTVLHVKLTGNAFWYLGSAGGRRIDAILPLNPKRVSIVPGNQNNVAGYLLKVRGVNVPLTVEEVIHFKRPHPDHDYMGIGDMEAGETVFNECINRDRWAEGFWKNGASPSGVLTLNTDRPPSQQDWEQAKAKWQGEYGGVKNSGKTAWLAGNWTYLQLGLTAQEMQNLEHTRNTIETIFLIHGVPLSVAGVREAANYATASIDEQRFRKYTVAPMCRIIQDTVNTDLVPRFVEGVQFTFAIAGLVNAGQVVTEYAPAFDRGIISINEFRQLMGLPTDPDNPLWNAHYITAGLTPLELAGVPAQGVEDEAKAIVQRSIQHALSDPAPALDGYPARRRFD